MLLDYSVVQVLILFYDVCIFIVDGKVVGIFCGGFEKILGSIGGSLWNRDF